MYIYPWLSSLPYALLLCLGVNVHDSGAGPKNISEIFTQSLLSALASNVSAECELSFVNRSAMFISTHLIRLDRGMLGHDH